VLRIDATHDIEMTTEVAPALGHRAIRSSL
jgi:hypothetical protein